LKANRGKRQPLPAPPPELAELRLRLAEAEETLHAIGRGEVDAVLVAGKRGDRVFTLEGAEHAYRVLIESMNEGALTLTADATILYANQCFAKMVKCPLERVTGSSLSRFLAAEDRVALQRFLKRTDRSGAKIQMPLNAADGSQMPAQISIRPIEKSGLDGATIGLVVTDITEVRRAEELLRALTHRVVQAQEGERARVARELHDNVTQLLCAVHFRSQALAGRLSARGGPMEREAIQLSKMLGDSAKEVERIARNLRPNALRHMGLVHVLRSSGAEFEHRTGVSFSMACEKMTTRLPTDTELALFRIFQEALQNVQKHAHAHHVVVCFRRRGAFAPLAINYDGVGFRLNRPPIARKGRRGLGLLDMRERAICVGGALQIKSIRSRGTKVEVRVPLA
jgi:PAS domain S-box-containing protein